MLKAEGHNMLIVNQVANGLSFAKGVIENHHVAFRFAQQHERRRRQDISQIVQGDFERDRRMKHSRMSDNSEELINAGPWDRPGKRAFRQALQQRTGGGVAPV